MKERIPEALRNKVWLQYMGNRVTGLCYCCEVETISRGTFECGHVVAESRGGPTDITNLRPVCGLCNKSMGVSDMNDFRMRYFKLSQVGTKQKILAAPTMPAKNKSTNLVQVRVGMFTSSCESSDDADNTCKK